jgi:hypothetical protein
MSNTFLVAAVLLLSFATAGPQQCLAMCENDAACDAECPDCRPMANGDGSWCINLKNGTVSYTTCPSSPMTPLPGRCNNYGCATHHYIAGTCITNQFDSKMYNCDGYGVTVVNYASYYCRGAGKKEQLPTTCTNRTKGSQKNGYERWSCAHDRG